MRLLTTALLVILLTTPATLAFETCSCTADDGRCSANLSCPGGCVAYCPNGGGCRAKCVTNSEGGGSNYEIIQMRATVQIKGGNANDLAAALAGITGREVVFVPTMPEHPISLDVKGAPVWDILEILAEHGKVQIGGDDFSTLQLIRKALVTGERMSICIRGASVRRVVDELEALSGLSIQVTSGDAHRLVTLSAKGVTLNELLAQMSDQAGVQISQK